MKVVEIKPNFENHISDLNYSPLPLNIHQTEQINLPEIELFPRDGKRSILNDLTKIIFIKKDKNNPLKVVFLDFEIIINHQIEGVEHQSDVSIIDINRDKIYFKNLKKTKFSDSRISLVVKNNEFVFSSDNRLKEFTGSKLLGIELDKMGTQPTALEYNKFFSQYARIIELNIFNPAGNKTYYIPVYLFPISSLVTKRNIWKILKNEDHKKEFLSNISKFKVTDNLESALESIHQKTPSPTEDLIDFGSVKIKSDQPPTVVTENHNCNLHNLPKAEIFPVFIHLKKFNDFFQNIIIAKAENNNSLNFNDFRVEITFPERKDPINISHLKTTVSIALPQSEKKLFCKKIDINKKNNKLILSVSPGCFVFPNKLEMEAISGGKLGQDNGFPMYGNNHPIHKSIDTLNAIEYSKLFKEFERIVEVILYNSEYKYTFSLPCYLLRDQSFNCSKSIGQILNNPISTNHFVTTLTELKKRSFASESKIIQNDLKTMNLTNGVSTSANNSFQALKTITPIFKNMQAIPIWQRQPLIQGISSPVLNQQSNYNN